MNCPKCAPGTPSRVTVNNALRLGRCDRGHEWEIQPMTEFPIQLPLCNENYQKTLHRVIPWAVAEVAYAKYAMLYGASQTLERMAERGGFGHLEMDTFHPTWREHVEQLRAERVLGIELSEIAFAVGGGPSLLPQELYARIDKALSKARELGWFHL